MTPKDQHDFDQKTIQTLADAIDIAIERNVGEKRFLDLDRIPLICLSISNISKTLEKYIIDVNVIFDEIRVMIKEMKADEEKKHETFLTKESFEQQFTPYKKAMNMIGGIVLVSVVTACLSFIGSKVLSFLSK